MGSCWKRLQDLAIRQHGHFTIGQAEAVGLTRPAVHYQFNEGRIIRPERGVCRFAVNPPTDWQREAVLMLWSPLDAAITFSHETALPHLDLGDAFPAKYHLTVSGTFRMRPPQDITLHKAGLKASEVPQEDILRFTNPTRTLLDLAHDGLPDRPASNLVRNRPIPRTDTVGLAGA